MSRLALAWSGVVAVTAAWALTASMVAPGTPLLALFAMLVVAFGTGAVLTGWVRVAAVAALLVSTLVEQLAATYRTDEADSGLASTFVTPLIIVLAPVLAGALVGRSRRQSERLRTLTAELATERAAHTAAAALEERHRVARELHDVISHSVSQMVVQAGAAEQQVAADDPARSTLQAIRSTGRQALVELREQLGVLGDGPDARPLAVPALADVQQLVLGAEADLEIDHDALGHVPAGPALTAYRVVQEALTNARRHSDGGSVRVRVGREGDLLAVEVLNGPGRRRADASVPGPGHGLTGMRERVALYAGELETGPTSEGGWRVRATVPLGAPA